MSDSTVFSAEEQRRYLRHLILPAFGSEGQRKLKEASVLVVGCGGLGSPALMYLAAAGVGRLGFCDFDVVNETNLQRQVLFGDANLGELKTDAAQRRLAEINPLISLEPHCVQLTRLNAVQLFADYRLILDGSDNFATRYLVNDACVLARKPYVYGSVSQFEGQVSLFGGDGPCYRCLFPEPPPAGAIPTCAEAGVLGVLPGIVGTLQAVEAIKHLAALGETLSGKLLLVDALAMRFHTIQVPKDPACPVCGKAPTIRELQDYETVCGDHPDQAAVPTIAPRALRELLNNGGVQLIDVREAPEWNFVRIEGARLMPLSEFEAHLNELDPRREIVVMCRSGRRSADVTRYLLQRGFPRVRNLDGGILAWRREIDPTLPEY